MDQALLLIQAYQTWIYLVLAVAFVLYARNAGLWWRTYRRSEFGLERERARRRIARAGVMGVWVALVAGLTFLAATVLSPSVPAPLPPPPPRGGPRAPPPLPEAALDASGCLNPSATLTFPTDGSDLSGSVSIQGTADIPNFAFFKYEYIELAAGLPA